MKFHWIFERIKEYENLGMSVFGAFLTFAPKGFYLTVNFHIWHIRIGLNPA